MSKTRALALVQVDTSIDERGVLTAAKLIDSVVHGRVVEYPEGARGLFLAGYLPARIPFHRSALLENRLFRIDALLQTKSYS